MKEIPEASSTVVSIYFVLISSPQNIQRNDGTLLRKLVVDSNEKIWFKKREMEKSDRTIVAELRLANKKWKVVLVLHG